MYKIIVIEDDEEMISYFKQVFRTQINVQVTYCNTFLRGIAEVTHNKYDLFIVDYQLDNGATGFDILSVIATKLNLNNRVIMLSAHSTTELMVSAYNLGVSNFIRKPVNKDIIVAVIKKNIRMLDDRPFDKISIGQFELDLRLQILSESVGEQLQEVPLTPIEYRIMLLFISRPARIINKEELCFVSKDINVPLNFKSLEMHISNLRSKSPTLNNSIKTKRGVGYYLTV